MEKDGQWLFERCNVEIWRASDDEYDTREQAIEAGRKYFKEEEGLDSEENYFAIGQVSHTSVFVDADYVIENVAERVYDNVGEVAEDYLSDVKLEHRTKLSEMLTETFTKWMKEHSYEPTFYSVVNVEDVPLGE